MGRWPLRIKFRTKLNDFVDDVSYGARNGTVFEWNIFPFFFFFLIYVYIIQNYVLYGVRNIYSQPRARMRARTCAGVYRGRLKNYRLSGGLQMAHKTKWIAGLSVVIRSVTSKYRCTPG